MPVRAAEAIGSDWLVPLLQREKARLYGAWLVRSKSCVAPRSTTTMHVAY